MRKLLLSIVLLISCICLPLKADTGGVIVKAQPVTADPGTTFELSVEMDNPIEITSLQFDLEFPEGISLALDGRGRPIFSLSSRKAADHTASANQENGRFMIVSMSSQPFNGDSGEIIKITVNVSAIPDGIYTMKIKDIVVTDASANGKRYTPDDFTVTLNIGDVSLSGNYDLDNNGVTDESDVSVLAEIILEMTDENLNADVNGDGRVSVSDVPALVNIIEQ